MNRNLVEVALQELGPEDRALLELSVVRGVSDEDIAGLLSVEITRVLIKREEALGRVSALIGEDPEEVLRTMRDLPTTRWRHEREPAAELELEPEPEPEAEPEVESEPEPESGPPPEKPEDQGGVPLALLGGLAVTLVVVVVLALTGGDDDPVQEPTPATREATRGGTLAPLAGSRASGTARLEGGRLVMDVRGLPDAKSGGYVVWLYDSVTDVRALAGFRRGRTRVTARLPEGFRRYRFVDISREQPDGNSNHSGQSVLRVPTAGLR